MRASMLLLALTLALPCSSALAVKEAPYRTQDRMPDVLKMPSPSQVWLGGYLGKRVLANEKARLLKVDEEPILVGFEKKPGSHPWIGEHAGKWLHAATLAWVYTGDPALKAKLDRVVARLVAAQEPDGYLGTYVPEKRFGLYPDADWDVWSHKYNLIGLLTYYHYTGAAPALTACRKMGDLLIRTFGPGRKSILSAGTHMGMAATSVLEPMVLLYRTTGDPRYLEFARYIVRSWDEPGGPAILKSLTAHRSVGQTANGKAYEMMSNLVGLCELARATGERRYLVPALNAWEDIVAHQRYLTGTVSYGEHFHASYDLPNTPSASVGETCATVTWLQLNAQLLRLTGAAKYANELERTYYNHLAAAQRPGGAEWCYYTALEGTKPYGPGISCCVSSGPRGMALIPQLSYMTGGTDRIVVNTLETSRFTTRLGGRQVTLEQKSGFPLSGQTTLTVHTSGPATFAIWVR
ncbi:MAG TPA: beta-L-arabinofuranosidase domain-containing protein, partial [Armatimonadota bacterium]